MNRLIGLVTSFSLVVWAAVVVPMPFYEVKPGSAQSIESLITLSAAVGEVEGRLELLTVRQTTPNILEALWVGVHPERELVPSGQRTPAGLELETYFEIQRDAFRTSFLTAVAVGAREAGYTVELDTTAVVAQVLRDGPSDGLLLPGDAITAIDGTPVTSGPDLVAELQASDEPRPVTLDLVREGQERTVTVDLQRLPSTDHPALGIIVETLVEEPDLPFEATLEDTRIGGPSAGLMMAVTAADLLLEEDLTRGRVIAGTGTITLEGDVGLVTGVREKAQAAIEADADLLLVPIGLVQEAAVAAEAGIEVVGVATFQDALDALRGSSTGVAAGVG